jgi:pilus assembly protein CpaF
MTSPLDLGPLQPLLDDPSVSEIMINGPKKVFVERAGRKVATAVTFSDERDVLQLVERIFASTGKRVGTDVPYGDTCLADGTRVNAIVFPLSRLGISVTVRKFSEDIHSLDDLIRRGTLTKKAADLLVACVVGKINMLLSGGTGVGKTTLLQVLSAHFAARERVITIEDAAELRMDQENVVSLETRSPDRDGRGEVTLRDLIRNSLRMAPDRLVLGEVRGAEALDMLQAMSTGTSGTIGVIHGTSPRGVIARLETMVMMSGVNLPLIEVRRLIVSTIPLVVHLERLADGSRRITAMTELRGMHRDEIEFNDLMLLDSEGTDEQGRILGNLKVVMRHHPQFFRKLQALGLMSNSFFVKE